MAVNIPWICKRVLEDDVSHETEGSARITHSPRASSTHSNIDAGFGVKKGWVRCDDLWLKNNRFKNCHFKDSITIQRKPIQTVDSNTISSKTVDSKKALGCPLTNALTFSLTNGLQYRGVVESHEKDESRRELEALQALCGMSAGQQ